jgi:hypothetical protein
MVEEPTHEPPEFSEFDDLYHKVVRCDWHDPGLKDHVKALEMFLAKHRELYGNQYFVPCIENARGHCRSAGLMFNF